MNSTSTSATAPTTATTVPSAPLPRAAEVVCRTAPVAARTSVAVRQRVTWRFS